MDTITHIAIGACTGELIAGKKLGKKAMLWGALANNIPDIDVVTYLWMSPADSLLAHRGFTHSILFQLLLAPVLAWVLTKIYKKENFSFREWCIFIGSGLFLHILLDALTAYGTAWFEPFSHYRVALNVLFILDPFFSISFWIGAIVLLILKSTLKRRRKLAIIFVSISGAYLLFAMVNKIQVNEKIERSLVKNNLSNENYFSNPTPLNNFLWYIVASDSTGFHLGYYSVFDKSDDVLYTLITRDTLLADSLKDNKDMQKLVRFSQGYYLLQRERDLVVFSDLRMGQVTGWANPEAPFVFRYLITEASYDRLMIQRGRWEASSGDALKKLVKRIFEGRKQDS